MATATVTLTATSAAMIFKDRPFLNDNGPKIYKMNATAEISGARNLLFNLAEWDEDLKYNRLQQSYITLRMGEVTEGTSEFFSVRAISRFDENTIVWNDRGTLKKLLLNSDIFITRDRASNRTLEFSRIGDYNTMLALKEYGALMLAVGAGSYTDDSWILPKYTVEVYGGADNIWPTLTVEYDDSYLVPLVVRRASGPANNAFADRKKPQTFSWIANKKDSEYCVGDLKQESAIFRWSVGDTGEWHDVLPDNPTNTSITIPANTFPTAEIIKWYVNVTATSGQSYNSEDTYTFTTLDRETTATPSTPVSSYRNPRAPITFSWTTSNPTGSTPTGADLQYYNGTDWIDLGHVDGSANTFTAPANTFTVGSVQWRVRAYNADGVAGPWSSGVTFSTTDSNASAAPESPSGTVEDGSAPIVFRWVASNPTGSTPTGADLQRWVSNAWVDLAHVDGSATTYAAPANTFTAGTNYWHVRAYNADGVAGPWSAYATFTVVAAPLAPTVSAEAVPFAVIRWQVNGQQAWRATVDGKAYGPYFGTDKSFALPDYLEDGEHTVTVEVQGQYGLWSEPGSYTFTVTNQPGDQISLQGDFGVDAALRWDPPSPINDYLIYRDGVQIGHTTARTFTDRVVQGVHEWFVINRLPGGYYSRSNTVQGELSTDQLALALLAGGDWLELEKTATPSRMEDYAATQTVEIFHLAGQEYPEAETAPYKTMQAGFVVAWNISERAQAAAFEALIGKPIIYKAPSGETLVGILQAFNKQVVHFFRAYTATVQRIHWRDYVEDD